MPKLKLHIQQIKKDFDWLFLPILAFFLVSKDKTCFVCQLILVQTNQNDQIKLHIEFLVCCLSQATREFIEVGWIPPVHSGGEQVKYYVEYLLLGSDKWTAANHTPIRYIYILINIRPDLPLVVMFVVCEKRMFLKLKNVTFMYTIDLFLLLTL